MKILVKVLERPTEGLVFLTVSLAQRITSLIRVPFEHASAVCPALIRPRCVSATMPIATSEEAALLPHPLKMVLGLLLLEMQMSLHLLLLQRRASSLCTKQYC